LNEWEKTPLLQMMVALVEGGLEVIQKMPQNFKTIVEFPANLYRLHLLLTFENTCGAMIPGGLLVGLPDVVQVVINIWLMSTYSTFNTRIARTTST
jgi:hypothetical protein